jgi:hypothetical protein
MLTEDQISDVLVELRERAQYAVSFAPEELPSIDAAIRLLVVRRNKIGGCMGNWISVKDLLPPIGDLVAGVMSWTNKDGSRHHLKCCAVRRQEKFRSRCYPWLINGCPSRGDLIAYWMPLPEPPIGDTSHA